MAYRWSVPVSEATPSWANPCLGTIILHPKSTLTLDVRVGKDGWHEGRLVAPDRLTHAGAGFALATSFDKAPLVLELAPGGGYRIARQTGAGQSSLGEGQYTLTAKELTFGPDAGQLGCSAIGVDKGVYGWKVEQDTLVLTLIADECDDRAYPLSALPWSRTEMPYSIAP